MWLGDVEREGRGWEKCLYNSEVALEPGLKTVQRGRRYHFLGQAIPLGYGAREIWHISVLRTVVGN